MAEGTEKKELRMQNDLPGDNEILEPTASEFLREYEQWNFIKVELYARLEDILAVKWTKINGPKWTMDDDKRYELTHIIHRWLMHINEHYNDVPKYDWFCLLPAVSADHRAAKFLMDAIEEKKDVKNAKMFVKDYKSAKESIVELFKFIEDNHASIQEKYADNNIDLQVRYDSASKEFVLQNIEIRQTDYDASIKKKCADKFIDLQVNDSASKEFVKDFKIRQTDRVAFLVKKAGLKNTIRMLLRYESLGMGSYQWGLPQKFYSFLYDSFGVRFEAFASPMTSRYIEFSDAKFCSLFPDTDSQFGSLGDFFKINMEEHKGGWTVNPPFVPDLILRAAERIIETLDSGEHWFFICSFPFWKKKPLWNEDPGWKLLNDSQYRRKRFDIKRETFDIQKADGEPLLYRAEMSLFVLARNKIEEAKLTELEDVLTEMGCVFIDIE